MAPLSNTGNTGDTAPLSDTAPVSAAVVNATSAREIPHVFGEFRSLMGVMRVSSGTSRKCDTAVIIVTSGTADQVGPFRLQVELARALLAKKIPSFRFESPGNRNGADVGDDGFTIAGAAAELSGAMDLIENQYGIKKFILFGLCDGADSSFYTAQQDKRVCGAVLMDGRGYRTSRYTIHQLLGHFLRRAISPQKWIDVVNGRLSQPVDPVTVLYGNDIREFPEQREAGVQIQSLVGRDVCLRFVFTGYAEEFRDQESQPLDTFADAKANRSVSTVFFPQMEALAVDEDDRQRLVADIVSWTLANVNRPVLVG